ncbi:hypothetical protein GRJ2_000119400 [Grus japonensis]|uniref:Uncharacterized protein n=1 Tax=Grus japonensis TaxID=30415 RepID=A0ABC9VXP9_GRUJA
MGRASYKASFHVSQLNIPYGDRDATLAAEPDPSRRDHHWHSPSSHATSLAMVNPGQQEEAWQGGSSGNRQGQQQQVQADDVPHLLQWHNRAGRGRRQQQQQQHRRRQYFNRESQLGQQEKEKDLVEQDARASSSNAFRKKGGQHRSSAHEQPREARWRGHNWRRNRRRQRIQPFRQDQVGGQEKVLFWNVKKHCWVTTLHMPTATLREASVCLRPMNMAGYCLPGMCTPHNTSQYIMDQHNNTWRNEEEAAAAKSRGSGNYSTAAEDFPLMALLCSTAQENEGTSTEEEEEGEHAACQD